MAMDYKRVSKRQPTPKRSKNGEPELVPDYPATLDCLNHAAEEYVEATDKYMDSYANDPDLPEKIAECERTARKLIGWARSWYEINSKDTEIKQSILDLLDRISKDSACRLATLWQEKKRLSSEEPSPERDEKIKRMNKTEDKTDFFTLSCLKTQQFYIDKFQNGGDAVNPEIEAETKAARQLERILPKLPRGKLFTRGIIYPMERIPVGHRVPDQPDVIERVKYMDPEDLVYDEELDELVVRPGYVSEDGLVDDKSVVWDKESMTVEMGYVGGVRTVWRYWKPKDSRDLMPPGSWVKEYGIRLYRQWLKDNEYTLLQHREIDDDYPWDRIPEWKLKQEAEEKDQ